MRCVCRLVAINSAVTHSGRARRPAHRTDSVEARTALWVAQKPILLPKRVFLGVIFLRARVFGGVGHGFEGHSSLRALDRRFDGICAGLNYDRVDQFQATFLTARWFRNECADRVLGERGERLDKGKSKVPASLCKFVVRSLILRQFGLLQSRSCVLGVVPVHYE